MTVVEISCNGSTLCMYKSDCVPRVGEEIEFMLQNDRSVYRVISVRHVIKASSIEPLYGYAISLVFVQVQRMSGSIVETSLVTG